MGMAAMLSLSLAAPASAHHHGQGGCQNIAAAVNVLGETAVSVRERIRESNACLGAIMAQMGKLKEFHVEKLRLKEEQLQTQVENGVRTQEEADAILAQIEERQANCDGSGNGNGNGYCNGSGSGYGYCDGSYHEDGICDGTCVGYGNGNGNGSGNGNGYGACDGSGMGRGNGGHGGHHGGGHGCW